MVCFKIGVLFRAHDKSKQSKLVLVKLFNWEHKFIPLIEILLLVLLIIRFHRQLRRHLLVVNWLLLHDSHLVGHLLLLRVHLLHRLVRRWKLRLEILLHLELLLHRVIAHVLVGLHLSVVDHDALLDVVVQLLALCIGQLVKVEL